MVQHGANPFKDNFTTCCRRIRDEDHVIHPGPPARTIGSLVCPYKVACNAGNLDLIKAMVENVTMADMIKELQSKLDQLYFYPLRHLPPFYNLLRSDPAASYSGSFWTT